MISSSSSRARTRQLKQRKSVRILSSVHNLDNFDETTVSKILKITDLEKTTEVDDLQRSSGITQHTEAWHFKGAYIWVSFENVILKPDKGVDKNQSIFQVWIKLNRTSLKAGFWKEQSSETAYIRGKGKHESHLLDVEDWWTFGCPLCTNHTS